MGEGGEEVAGLRLGDEVRINAGMGGTGGGVDDLVGLGGGERYGTAFERHRRWSMERGESERCKERGVDGDEEGGEWARVERALVGLSSESLARREREALVSR